MQPSMEVRWFKLGEPPADLQAWFASDGASHSEEPREDWYLILPRRDLGIKQRLGRLEIKQRLVTRGVQKLRSSRGNASRSGIKGRVEQWIKWGFAIDPDALDAQLDRTFWLPVQKQRQIKRYGITSTGNIEAIAADQTVERGCTIELCAIEFQNQQWHSLGCESFGKLDEVEATLHLVLNHIFANSNVPHLKAKHSFSYPVWLKRSKQQK